MNDEIDKLISLGQQQRAHGQWAPAAQTFQKILALNPEYYPAWNLLGKTLNNLRQLDHAAEAFRRAIKLKPDVAEFHHNLGHVLRFRGGPDQAIQCFKQAMRLDPNYAAAYHSLGSLYLQKDDTEQAAPLLLEAVRHAPENSRFHTSLAVTLHKLKSIDKARMHYQKAIELDGKNAQAISNYAILQEEQGDIEQAERDYRHALTLNPLDSNAMSNLGNMLLADGRYNNVLTISSQYLKHDPGNSAALALQVMAHIGNGGNQLPVNELMDYARFLVIQDVTEFGDFSTTGEMNQALAQHILNHPSLKYEPDGHATRFGRHTGELLVDPKGPMATLEVAIKNAIEHYLRNLSKDDHPFVAGLPDHWHLTAWAVVMEEQGHQLPHIHPAAWLSGVYYVRLPTLIETSQKKAGWIEFGRPPKDVLDKENFLIKQLQPKEGQMLLFPSYFYHETIPFESELERISIAFDVVPHR